MLHSLRVKNLAIVENTQAVFGPGLNVITGETGAGKSVLVGALDLVLGGRADKSLIRTGEDRAGVEALFVLADPDAVDAVLDELGLDPCDEGRLLVRRIVSASGSGRILINDAPATVQTLRRLGDLLVDMHGPHDHQSILNPAFQIDLLDAFGRLAGLRDAYLTVHERVLELDRRRAALAGGDADLTRRIDGLTFQVREIGDAGLDGLAEDALEREHAAVANAQRIMELSAGICGVLTDDDVCTFQALVGVQQGLRELARVLPEAEAWLRDAEALALQVQELSSAVSGRAQAIEGDPARLQWLEDRMAVLHRLKRKYGGSLDAIMEARASAEAELAELTSRGERLAELERERAAACIRRRERGEALRADRQEAAIALGAAVSDELGALGFEHGRFEVGIMSCEPGPSGMDQVDFGFAPNPGESMRPLRLIASSGEISRVMLATKAVLAAHDRIPVLVFDEIDANLGGEMGHAVGAKLAAVAATHQVICITHLPQVAVHGTTHFRVSKAVADGRTRAAIERLPDREREAEVARMLGGRDGTSLAHKHAREMLTQAGTRARGTEPDG